MMGLGRHNIEFNCDSPPYAVVEVCHNIGIDRPLDVAWSHLDWGHWDKKELPRTVICRCLKRSGIALLPFHPTFTYGTGMEVSYWMAQCRRCLTVYWTE
jgi:hypothetical protein